ncbi:phosphoglycerate mutase-like protein 4 [Rhodamnia argentea]|uniref:Phosphoglycerate mutase-like protein 4 n=1 Tax=Rhodamnia argentea TaxID=178133 RepID=A0A8B8PVJ7_9MYRT|nr:phosphoglycerate mutase-like protein 4 [Rhodamnia argentea]
MPTCDSVSDAFELNHERDDAQSVAITSDRAEIILVRHGQTESNVEKRIQGHLDVELTEAGRQQARAVADRLAKEGEISAIYSSDLKRATDTAELIAMACGGVNVIKDPDLRERNAGTLLQGLKRSAAPQKQPEAYRSRERDQEIPGGGESKDQLYRRCTTCLQNIGLNHKGERVVVVTHGGVFGSLYRMVHPNEGNSGPRIENTSIGILHLFGGDNWVVKSWGDISHLNQTKEKL